VLSTCLCFWPACLYVVGLSISPLARCAAEDPGAVGMRFGDAADASLTFVLGPGICLTLASVGTSKSPGRSGGLVPAIREYAGGSSESSVEACSSRT